MGGLTMTKTERRNLGMYLNLINTLLTLDKDTDKTFYDFVVEEAKRETIRELDKFRTAEATKR
jgi:hypothetical protein